MSENAPRPWKAVKTNTQWWCVLDANADLLADTLTETDARLIADAPALADEVKALREVARAASNVSNCGDLGDAEDDAAWQALRDALAACKEGP